MISRDVEKWSSIWLGAQALGNIDCFCCNSNTQTVSDRYRIGANATTPGPTRSTSEDMCVYLSLLWLSTRGPIYKHTSNGVPESCVLSGAKARAREGNGFLATRCLDK